ncbi:MAG: sulfur carrier protein ThiS [Deltaproteobacteria bacterium]|nr:sulfur carrier protein ThiS [Deltaproteobacteria bacterium]
MSEPITITLNGKLFPLQSAMELQNLVAQLGVKGAFAVAVNDEVVAKSDLTKVVLKQGDVVEIIHPVAGG